jgi:hypothetical protein
MRAAATAGRADADGRVGGEWFGERLGHRDRVSDCLLAQLRVGDYGDADGVARVRLELRWLGGRRVQWDRSVHRDDGLRSDGDRDVYG